MALEKCFPPITGLETKPMDIPQFAPFLKTAKPSELFKKKVEFNMDAAKSGNMALVRIGLGSGFIVEGTPLKMDKERNVIFTSSDKSVSYVNVNTITGIQIMNPEELMEVLTEGSYFNILESSVPTSLELKRNFKSFQEYFEKGYDFEVTNVILEKEVISDVEKYQFQQFLEVLKKSLDKISEDTLGEEALKSLKTLKIISGNALKVERTADKELTIEANFIKKLSADLVNDLQKALESSL